MLKEYYYRVAGQTFYLCVPPEQDIDLLLPSFRPFRCERPGEEEVLFKFIALTCFFQAAEVVTVLEEAKNEWGCTRIVQTTHGFQIECQCGKSEVTHGLRANPPFTLVTAVIHWNERHAGEILSLLLRLVYSQAILYRNGIALHASVVALDGKGYLFMGNSGTGKSTHASLWIGLFPGCELLNDDNPVVRIEEEGVMVYGTPWSGKTACYRNQRFPVRGIVRLVQALHNRFIRQEEVDAFITVLPGCAVFPQAESLHKKLCDTLIALTGRVPVGVLECLPNREAAQLCKSGIES